MLFDVTAGILLAFAMIKTLEFFWKELEKSKEKNQIHLNIGVLAVLIMACVMIFLAAWIY